MSTAKFNMLLLQSFSRSSHECLCPISTARDERSTCCTKQKFKQHSSFPFILLVLTTNFLKNVILNSLYNIYVVNSYQKTPRPFQNSCDVASFLDLLTKYFIQVTTTSSTLLLSKNDDGEVVQLLTTHLFHLDDVIHNHM